MNGNEGSETRRGEWTRGGKRADGQKVAQIFHLIKKEKQERKDRGRRGHERKRKELQKYNNNNAEKNHNERPPQGRKKKIKGNRRVRKK